MTMLARHSHAFGGPLASADFLNHTKTHPTRILQKRRRSHPVELYIDHSNSHPKSFVWANRVDKFLEKCLAFSRRVSYTILE